MQDAPFARRHRVETERGVRFADAAGGNAGGKLQFLDSDASVAGGVKSNASVELRIEPKPAQGDVFKRQEQFRIAFQQQILIAALELDENFRIFKLLGCSKTHGVNFIRELEAAFLKQGVDAAAQFRRNGRVIQLSIRDQIRAGYRRQDCSP